MQVRIRPLVTLGLLAAAALALLLRGVPARVTRETARSRHPPARRLAIASGVLAGSVLADSALEHYRGGFYDPVMVAAPVTAAITLGTAASAALRPAMPSQRLRSRYIAAVIVGVVGLGFHVFNVSRQTGGWRWGTLFYGAPIGAPFALALAGLLGLAGLRRSGAQPDARRLGIDADRVLALGVAGALVGTSAEAALLHFRGAFQDPFMILPVTIPPLTALSLAVAAVTGNPKRASLARSLLRATAVVGLAGVAFHALGVARNMGGWRNWSQNVLSGPPLPAPPSFTGIALAGLAALDLLSGEHTA